MLQIFQNGVDFSFTLLSNEYIPFYLFQKAPIYILGYSAIAIILHFYITNEQLQIEVQHLSELKDNNLNLYNQLKSEVNDKATILNIKIGNKRKIIPVEEIFWIEADDYCVKVHLNNSKTYTMRSSLKALEAKLPIHFLRVHRKAIVNMKTAKELTSAKSPFLILKNDHKIQVSKSNFNRVKTFIS
ncbi:MAG: LytTR family transcriptional regulator [Flavobacteriaceae bacterium]|nr:LytTR family transcriptional regulator [Flavobacteriaceae bacterium]